MENEEKKTLHSHPVIGYSPYKGAVIIMNYRSPEFLQKTGRKKGYIYAACHARPVRMQSGVTCE